MNKLLLLLTLATALMFQAAKAQEQTNSSLSQPEKKHIVTIAPFGFVNKFKIKYERVLTSKFTTGATFAQYYGTYPGTQFTGFSRLYFGNEAPDGLYLQGQVAVFKHTYEIDEERPELKQTFTSGGAGIGLGYQWLSGKKKNIVIDIMGGLKLYNMPERKDEIEIEQEALQGISWYYTGPGSFFNGTIGIGYAF
jgi:hypothetical protein